MTVAAFTASISGIGKFTHTERIKLFAWYLLRYKKRDSFSASDISACFNETSFPPPSSVHPFLVSLEKRKPKVLIGRKGGAFSLEHSVVAEFDARYGQRPTAAAVKHDLRQHIAAIKDPEVVNYLEETIGCFEHEHFRASIVMAWCSGFAILKAWLFSIHLPALNAVMANWRVPKAIARIDDFEELTERVLLDTARTGQVLSKEQHKHLVSLLDQRNSFAHPSGRKVSPALAEAYLIQVMDEVITRYS